MTLREKLLNRPRRTVKVSVPELDTDVYLGVWSGAERAAFHMWYGPEKRSELFGRVLCMSLFDESGNRVFTDDDVMHVQQCLDGVVAERLTLEALRLNGIAKEAVEDAKNDSRASGDSTTS